MFPIDQDQEIVQKHEETPDGDRKIEPGDRYGSGLDLDITKFDHLLDPSDQKDRKADQDGEKDHFSDEPYSLLFETLLKKELHIHVDPTLDPHPGPQENDPDVEVSQDFIGPGKAP